MRLPRASSSLPRGGRLAPTCVLGHTEGCTAMLASSLARSLAGISDMSVARAVVAERLALDGVDGFAKELEPLLAGASLAARDERRGALVLASWVAHVSAAGAAALLLDIGAAADPDELPLVHATFGRGASAALKRGARLADVGIAVFANISGTRSRRWPDESLEDWQASQAWCNQSPAVRRFMARRIQDRARLHHDPVFIGRLLDQRWISVADVLVVASRRPTLPAIVLAVATRDRWFREARVRAAIAENPFAPPTLRRLLRLAGAGTKALGTPIHP